MNKFNNIMVLFQNSGRKLEVLRGEEDKNYGIKEKYKIPETSYIGAVVYNSGGMIVDNKIRLYGVGGSLSIDTKNEKWGLPNYFLLGEDIFGGLFAVTADGGMSYFAPDNIAWENMEIDYEDFINWLAKGDAEVFYERFMYAGWEKDACELKPSQGLLSIPFLWADCSEGEERKHKIVPMDEIIGLNYEFLIELNNKEEF